MIFVQYYERPTITSTDEVELNRSPESVCSRKFRIVNFFCLLEHFTSPLHTQSWIPTRTGLYPPIVVNQLDIEAALRWRNPSLANKMRSKNRFVSLKVPNTIGNLQNIIFIVVYSSALDDWQHQNP